MIGGQQKTHDRRQTQQLMICIVDAQYTEDSLAVRVWSSFVAHCNEIGKREQEQGKLSSAYNQSYSVEASGPLR